MVKIKICGMMSMDDIEAVNKLKPDYAGFIFAPGRRRLTVAKAQELCAALHKDILSVGVFVNEKPEVIRYVQEECGLNVLQIYQDNNENEVSFSGTIWRAIRIKDKSSLLAIKSKKADAYLLDAYSEAAYGGTGETFNWELVQYAARGAKIVLAGGLTPDNVEQAIAIAAPYAVDTSSGVETDGVKDKSKIKDFVDRARRA